MLIFENYLTEVIRPKLQEQDVLNRVLTSNNGIGKYNPNEYGAINSPDMSSLTYSYVYWYYFDKSNLNIDLQLPFDNYKWWIMLTHPGQFLPVHKDPDVQAGSARYSVPLQDYIPGHVLVLGDKLITNYKAGDVYKWEDPTIEHFVANVTSIPRVTLQIGAGPGYERKK